MTRVAQRPHEVGCTVFLDVRSEGLWDNVDCMRTSTCLPVFLLVCRLAGCEDNGTDDDLQKAAIAEQEARKAIQSANEAQAKLDKLTKDLDALNEKLAKALDAVLTAHNDADRAAAKARLQQLQQEQAELRHIQVPIGDFDTPECLRNPLAKGCAAR